MIPQIDNYIATDTFKIITYPNKTYKFSEEQITGKITDLEAIKQSIQHILSIERYAYIIYDDNYGVELQKYIGQDVSYVEATIEDTLKEALTQDDRILDVKVTNISAKKELQKTEFENVYFKELQTENHKNLVTEVDQIQLITSKQKLITTGKNAKMLIVTVEFDVYCKQGVIHTEVDLNV